MVRSVHRKSFECFLQALIREACFMCRYFAPKWTVNIFEEFWFRFVLASWLIQLKCRLADTNYYTYTQVPVQVSWFVEPRGAPWWAMMSFPVDERPEAPTVGLSGPVSSFFSSVYRGTWLSRYPVFLCSRRRLCVTLCLHKGSQWQRCSGGGGGGGGGGSDSSQKKGRAWPSAEH